MTCSHNALLDKLVGWGQSVVHYFSHCTVEHYESTIEGISILNTHWDNGVVTDTQPESMHFIYFYVLEEVGVA